MGGRLAITGDDTLIINDRPIVDLADDDVSSITFPNDKANAKTGKNKNTLYSKNEAGNNAELSLRLVIGSDDDKFLNSLMASQDQDFAGFDTLEGSFAKRVGSGDGTVASVIYDISGGIFKKGVDAKENVSGDTSQAVAVYTILFARADRRIA